MPEISQEAAQQDDAPATVRLLAHEATNALSVVTLGLNALQISRDDAAQFDEVHAMIQQDGVVPLKQHLAALIDLLLESQEDLA
ncbi:MAG: hypothetical protein WD030_11465 [Pirellulales bacterium]